MKTILKQVMLTLAALLLAAASGSAQVLAPLTDFSDTNDANPTQVGLTLSGNTLYGTVFGIAYHGDRSKPNRPGAIFKLNTDGTGFTNMYIFSNVDQYSLTNTDGANPPGQLVLSGNKLYGTAEHGGFSANGIGYASGTVFAINTDGTGFTNLHNFNALADTNDGAYPSAGLLLAGNTLYGTTSSGGAFGAGTVFVIHTDGTGYTNLYNFSAPSANGTNTDGFGDKSGLILSGNILYGTARLGGSAGEGTVFAVNTNGTGFTNLHSFTALVRMTTPPYVYTNSDGADPGGGLVLSGNTLYGAAGFGGDNTNNNSYGGTVFALNTNGTGFTTLHSFGVQDGVTPSGGLVLLGNTLYGTTPNSGGLGEGTVFAINTNGTGFATIETFTPLSFGTNSSGTNVGGAYPVGNMVDSGSTLYGVTHYGGTNGGGLVFALNLLGAPPSIQFTASPTNGFTRLAVQFTSPAVDAAGNPIVSWNWNFSDDPNSTNTAQNPTHTYTNAATFLPTLTCINCYGETVVGSGPAITTSPLPPVQFTASPTNGVQPVTVHFTSRAVDAASNAIVSWNWNLGDGSSNTTQNPSHAYTNSGTFFPSLTCVNNYGDMLAGSGPAIVVSTSLLLNGGFETGTFTNWTQSGYTNSSHVTTGSFIAHSGKYGAELVAPATGGAMGFLSQTFLTVSGASYVISFWLDSPFNSTPNDFQVSWNGDVLLDETNLGSVGWTNFQLTATATGTSSTLQLGYLTGALYFGLDDVGVASIASGGSAPGITHVTASGTNLVINGSGGQSGQTYYLLMGTNLAEPFAQWIPVASNTPATSGNFSITATNAVSPNAPKRFFILLSP